MYGVSKPFNDTCHGHGNMGVGGHLVAIGNHGEVKFIQNFGKVINSEPITEI